MALPEGSHPVCPFLASRHRGKPSEETAVPAARLCPRAGEAPASVNAIPSQAAASRPPEAGAQPRRRGPSEVTDGPRTAWVVSPARVCRAVSPLGQIPSQCWIRPETRAGVQSERETWTGPRIFPSNALAPGGLALA